MRRSGGVEEVSGPCATVVDRYSVTPARLELVLEPKIELALHRFWHSNLGDQLLLQADRRRILNATMLLWHPRTDF